jgi:hypothetical protein
MASQSTGRPSKITRQFPKAPAAKTNACGMTSWELRSFGDFGRFGVESPYFISAWRTTSLPWLDVARSSLVSRSTGRVARDAKIVAAARLAGRGSHPIAPMSPAMPTWALIRGLSDIIRRCERDSAKR